MYKLKCAYPTAKLLFGDARDRADLAGLHLNQGVGGGGGKCYGDWGQKCSSSISADSLERICHLKMDTAVAESFVFDEGPFSFQVRENENREAEMQ